MALPQPASNEEKLKEFDSVPLFMRTLPGLEDEAYDGTAINALQSLVYDGTPDEIALNFKEQGNAYFKGKRYREALGFYTQGIDAKPDNVTLTEVLLCNRAACNLELQNYGSVLRDCSRAITLNPACLKAYYRSALALLALDRPDDALDVCHRCLRFDPQTSGMKALQERALNARKVKKGKENKVLEKLEKEKTHKKRMQSAFEERGLVVVGSPSDEYVPEFDERGDDAMSSLFLPTYFLYPQYAQSDMVPDLHEDVMLADQLSRMFPPDAPAPTWDTKHEYAVGKLAVYAVTHTKRLLKVGAKMTLRDVCNVAKSKDGKPDGLDFRDGFMSFVVVPKGEAERVWVEKFKSNRDRA